MIDTDFERQFIHEMHIEKNKDMHIENINLSMEVNHFKRIHTGIPIIIPRRMNGYIEFSFMFTDLSKYKTSKEENQLDWNKMIGMKSGLFSQLKDGVMCAWRYNPETDMFDVCLYVHGGISTKGKVGSGNAYASDTYISVMPGQVVHAVLTKNKDCAELIMLYNKDSIKRIKIDSQYAWTSGWTISPWFGGQETARVSYILNVQKIN